MQLERRPEVRCRLDDADARAALDLVELEDDLALVVPVEHEPLPWRRLSHDGAAFVAVVPAEDALAARVRVELHVVREPLLEPFRVGQRLPHLVGRGGDDDLALDLHDSSSLDTQPLGCARMRNQ